MSYHAVADSVLTYACRGAPTLRAWLGAHSVVEMLLTLALMMAMSPQCQMAGTGPWQGRAYLASCQMKGLLPAILNHNTKLKSRGLALQRCARVLA